MSALLFTGTVLVMETVVLLSVVVKSSLAEKGMSVSYSLSSASVLVVTVSVTLVVLVGEYCEYCDPLLEDLTRSVNVLVGEVAPGDFRVWVVVVVVVPLVPSLVTVLVVVVLKESGLGLEYVLLV